MKSCTNSRKHTRIEPASSSSEPSSLSLWLWRCPPPLAAAMSSSLSSFPPSSSHPSEDRRSAQTFHTKTKHYQSNSTPAVNTKCPTGHRSIRQDKQTHTIVIDNTIMREAATHVHKHNKKTSTHAHTTTQLRMHIRANTHMHFGHYTHKHTDRARRPPPPPSRSRWRAASPPVCPCTAPAWSRTATATQPPPGTGCTRRCCSTRTHPRAARAQATHTVEEDAWEEEVHRMTNRSRQKQW